jgi:hypothetical protein
MMIEWGQARRGVTNTLLKSNCDWKKDNRPVSNVSVPLSIMHRIASLTFYLFGPLVADTTHNVVSPCSGTS